MDHRRNRLKRLLSQVRVFYQYIFWAVALTLFRYFFALQLFLNLRQVNQVFRLRGRLSIKYPVRVPFVERTTPRMPTLRNPLLNPEVCSLNLIIAYILYDTSAWKSKVFPFPNINTFWSSVLPTRKVYHLSSSIPFLYFLMCWFYRRQKDDSWWRSAVKAHPDISLFEHHFLWDGCSYSGR